MNKEEVMKILKDFHGKSALFSVRTALETLHPELRENEDEKIRKELIEHVKDQQSSFISAPDCRDKYEEEENNKYNSWLAWLEKQGEQKSDTNCLLSWSEIDEKMFQSLEGIVKDYWAKAEQEKNEIKIREASNVSYFLKTIQKSPLCWIKCSDGLPNRDGTYLVVTDGRHNDVYDLARYDSIDGWHKASEILYWMPIPQLNNKSIIEHKSADWSEEDEKIRKALIEYFNEQCDMSDWNGVYGYQVVAWLEKQGEHKLPIEKLPEEMKTIEESLEFTTQEECDEYNQMVSGLIMSDDNKEEQKQNVDNKKLTDVNHEYFSELLENDDSKDINDYAYQVAYCMSHDWLEETATWEDVQKAVKLGAEWQKQKLTWSEEDEEIRKWIINEIKIKHHNLDEDNVDFVDKAIAWLEKQGKEDSSIQQAYEWGYTEGKRIERKHWIEKQNFSEDYNSIDPQFGKPINKVEPKFKDGDWVVFNDKHESVYQIEKIENFQYILRHILGGSMPLSFSGEDMIRPWAIQDARDGDVLACNEEILLFKSYSVQGRISLYCWYNGQTNNFHSKEVVDTLMTTRNKIYPATKEQRDILFSKMKEAGYEWDENNKMLKEIVEDEEEPQNYKNQIMSEITDLVKHYIKQKPACSEASEDIKEALRTEYEKGRADAFAQMQKEWSEEDEHRIKDTIYFLDTAKKHYASTVELDACIDWLKSLKERYTWKQSNELDEASYQVGIKRVLENPESYGLAKYNWKPSDEQMGVIEAVINNRSFQRRHLDSLYADLKKLKE